MGYDTKISSNAREQLEQFLGVFYTRFSKPRLKFLRQMLYGIQITKSVILNKIAAEIDENIKQVKIEMRLCHHLAFKDLWKQIHEAVMEHAKKFVRKSTLIIIDPSDVQKPYAKKMQYLAKVWDGSKGRVGDNLGYWGCMAVACEPGKRCGVVPPQFRLWSTEDPEFFYYAHPCTASRRATLVGYRGRNPEALHALREVECETRLEEGAAEIVTAARIRLC